MGVRKTDDSPIIFYLAEDLFNREFLRIVIQRAAEEGGLGRKIEFKSFRAYKDLPDREGDIYMFDAMLLSSLCYHGFLRPLDPDLNYDFTFGWADTTLRYDKKHYGVPFLYCINILVTRREDYREGMKLSDCIGDMTCALRSMMRFYYLEAFCNTQNKLIPSENRNFDVDVYMLMKQLRESMDDEEFENSLYRDYQGMARFANREKKHYLGYTEHIPLLGDGELVVTRPAFSLDAVSDIRLVATDMVSIASHVTGDKLSDCRKLQKLLISDRAQSDVSIKDGRYSYFLPTDKKVFERLAGEDKTYATLYEMTKAEDNFAFRYNERFPEEHLLMGEELTGLVEKQKN